MEVRLGWEQSEIGVIPADWEVAALGTQLIGTPTYGINAPAIPFDSRFWTYLRITDITKDGRFAESSRASIDHPRSVTYLLEPGDLVFARTGASVGKSYLYNQKDGRLVFAGFLIRLRPNPTKLIPAFLWYYTQSSKYWNWIKANSMRSGQPGINGQEYATLPVPIPPTKAEQEAIANALSDADALIESLEQLIAKKRHIKQGAMQEMLTGQRRLPGFSGDWKDEYIGSFCDITAGGDLVKEDFSATSDSKHCFAIYSNALTNKGLYGYSSSYQYEPDKITVTARGDIGTAFYRDKRFCAIGRLLVLSSKYNCDLRFVTEFINSFIDFAKESTGVPQLTAPQISTYTVTLPPTKAEQEAIATILSDMDSEIATLEAKLAKARQIKQGMMQELLTGRIRLVGTSSEGPAEPLGGLGKDEPARAARAGC